MVQSINKTPNRALNGRTPASVTKENEDEVRLDAYLARKKKKNTPPPRVKKSFKTKKRLPYTFKVGDQVRITHLRRTFQRDYDQTYVLRKFL